MWGNPTFFHRANSFEKNIAKCKYWQKLLKKILRKGEYRQKLLKKTFRKGVIDKIN